MAEKLVNLRSSQKEINLSVSQLANLDAITLAFLAWWRSCSCRRALDRDQILSRRALI